MDHPIRGGSIMTTATPASSASLQQQSHRGTVVCTTKDNNAWQPLVTPVSILPTSACVTEIPKESIIANTDFTVTSVIAKRRLSSKKRRSLRNSREEGLDISSIQPPSSTSTHSDTSPSAINTTSIHHGSVAGGIAGTGCIPINALPQPNQTVYSQTVPPEVVYQMLHQQHNITSHPSSVVTSSADSLPAAQQPHQLQYIESSTGQQLTYTVPDSSTHQQLPIKSSTITAAHQQQYKPSPTTAQHHPVTERPEMSSSNQQLEQHQMAVAVQQHTAAAIQQQIHQQQLLQHQQQLHYQQQLAMIQQLYGGIQTLVPTNTSNSAIPATITAGNTTGTVSNVGIQHPIQIQGSVPVIGHTSHPNQLISVPIQTVYAPPPGHTHSVPIATAFAPPELLLQVQNGSWVSAHHSATGMGFGSCIAGNPVIEPRLLTSSLVK